MELGRIYDCEINGNMTLKLDLIGGLEPWNFMTVHSVGNFIVPTDFHSIFQRGRLKPPTRYIHRYIYIVYIVCIINEYIYIYIYMYIYIYLSDYCSYRSHFFDGVYPNWFQFIPVIPSLSHYYPFIIPLLSNYSPY